MKLVTFSTSSDPTPSIGAVHNGNVYDLANCAKALGTTLPNNVRSLLEAGEAGLAKAKEVLSNAVSQGLLCFPESIVTLYAPITNPHKILCLAGNYQEHIQEGGGKAVDKTRITPRVFMKPITTLCGDGAPILLPEVSRWVDYELELAVIIGKPGRGIATADALNHVAGYAIYNDISSRKLTIAEGRDQRDGDGWFDWLNGKWQDNSGPMGPYIVTADELPNAENLWMKLWVNGELRQNANTSQMIFNVAETIAFASRLMTLQTGDIIATGTPSGVGATTQTYLKSGDVVRCEIESLGVLDNTVI
jgi:2-keto-4-pentenoate hydratase/2-oxohepta-3-ene-1,7-dioic acid hydratase in catechol pathway